MNRPIHRHPVTHVPATVALIGGLAVLLAAGLRVLGVLVRVDDWLAARLLAAMQQPLSEGFAKSLPEWALWVGTAVVACGLTLALLTVAGGWRRVVLWSSTLVLTAAWAPVLALASHSPRVAAPLVAVIWVGICAWFYARTHILPGEQATPPAPRPERTHSL